MIDKTACTIEILSGDQDLDDVASLEGRSFTNPWTREMLARELAHSQAARVYVLRLPGQRVAAFCACWIMAGELHLNTIAVDPARRRQGLGTLLVRHVIEDARAAGVHDATLEVRRSNSAAIRLYERLGFQVEGVRTNYYSEPTEDALILWRRDPPGTRHSP